MIFKIYTNVHEFYNDTYDVLLRLEAQNLILLGNLTYNITLYATDNIIDLNVINCLIDGLKDYEITGVLTEKTLAECFAKEFSARKELKYETIMNQRIYELKTVNPEIKQIGEVRLLNERDMYFFQYWVEGFSVNYDSTVMSIPQNEEDYRYRISTKKYYVLEVDGIPVSMVGYSREMKTAIGISFVYTPPYYRGRGYATSCVA